MPHKLSIPRVLRTMLRLYAYNWRIVLPVSIAAAGIPLAIDVLVAHELARVPASILTSVVDTVAVVFFAGAAEELEHRWERGERQIPLRGVLAGVPPVFWSLLAVSILAALGVAAGLLLLVIPGLVLGTWWALVGPVVVAERPGVFQAFGRSRKLVRGNGWRVLSVIVGAEILAVIVAAIVSATFQLFGDQPNQPVSLAVGEALTLPLEGLAVPIMYWRLREIEDARALEEEADEAETTHDEARVGESESE